jgi:hypothetical protein
LKSTDKKEKSITKDKSTSKLSSHRATMKDRDEDSFQHKSKKIYIKFYIF